MAELGALSAVTSLSLYLLFEIMMLLWELYISGQMIIASRQANTENEKASDSEGSKIPVPIDAIAYSI